ncbi:MAG: LysR family transcriptional regulator [Dysgonomonas sp.]|nr:LysR family transcriptional regulator [Dysgonomonas sp.]
MVNLEWYRTFKAIYQYGTLTKASQELMMSQPSMSIQLASLESYIGKPLFVRTPRKMMPTEYGKQLYTQIVESIDNLEKVESEFKRTVLSKAPNIRFGVPSEIFTNYLAENIGAQSDLYLTIEYGLANEFVERLINNELDIAIITRQPKEANVLTYEPLFIESFMVVGHPDKDTKELDNYTAVENYPEIEKWLKTQKWYAYSNDLALIRRFWRENFKRRPILKLQATIPDNGAILKAVSNSSALAVTSDIIAAKAIDADQVKVIWRGYQPTTNTIYLAYDKTKIPPQYVDKVRTFVKTYVNMPE